MKKNKTSESQIKATRKWEKKNTYKATITFYKHKLPEEMFEKAKEEIRKLGMSQSEFFTTKLKELVNEKGDDKNV